MEENVRGVGALPVFVDGIAYAHNMNKHLGIYPVRQGSRSSLLSGHYHAALRCVDDFYFSYTVLSLQWEKILL